MTAKSMVPLPFRSDEGCPLDPDPKYRWLRENEPVTQVVMPSGEPAWVITRYADAREVLRDHVRFSSVPPPLEIERPLSPDAHNRPLPRLRGFFATCDPPEHTKFRQMLAPEFTVRQIGRMRPRIEAVVAACFSAMERAGPPVDLVRAFALPVPTAVICDLLGVPVADHVKFQQLAASIEDLTVSHEQLRASFTELAAYAFGVAAEARRKPGDNLLGRIVTKHGSDLTDEELSGIFAMFLLAGYEGPANMLALGSLVLFRHPEQRNTICTDPDSVVPAVEELLRYLSVVHIGQVRTATEDVTIAGQLIRAGEYVMCSMSSANRDEQFRRNADEFDIGQRASAHIAFGYGPHQCLGQQLARMEMRIALPALFNHFKELRLAVPFEMVPFRRNTPIKAVRALPVTW
jgi:cytochrome P450